MTHALTFRCMLPMPDDEQALEADPITEICQRLKSGADAGAVRREFSGDRIYIAARPRLTEQQRAAVIRELGEKTAAEVAKRWGLSERQCYRLRRSKRRELP